MASLKARTSRAAALHRQAAATADAVGTALDAAPSPPPDDREQRDLADLLTAAAAALVPGWLGAPLTANSTHPLPDGDQPPRYVRIGTAEPLAGVCFPAVVPLLGAGHLVLDRDARDPRVAALLRALLLRLLAAAPAGSLLVRGIAGEGAAEVFAPFAPLADAGLLPPPATDRAGALTVLAEAERWVRPDRPGGRDRRRERVLLVVVAGLPEPVEPEDLARLRALAEGGVAAGLHLIVAGWPTEPANPAAASDRAASAPADTPTPAATPTPATAPTSPLAPTPAAASAPGLPAPAAAADRTDRAADRMDRAADRMDRAVVAERRTVAGPVGRVEPVVPVARVGPAVPAVRVDRSGRTPASDTAVRLATEPAARAGVLAPFPLSRTAGPAREDAARDQAAPPAAARNGMAGEQPAGDGRDTAAENGRARGARGRLAPPGMPAPVVPAGPATGPASRSTTAGSGLAEATMIEVRETYALVGDPPGASFGGRGPLPSSSGLNAPVLLDPDPPAELVDRVCRELARRFAVGCRPRLADLLPDGREYWTEDAGDGLTTVVGYDGDTPVTLRFAELTPHWLIAGRPGAGSSAFLANVLHGLCARYRPESLAIHLLSVRPGPAFGEFLPTGQDRSWLPHVRTAGVAADREYALTLLRELDAELDRRAVAFERAGATRLAGMPEPDRPPRVLCVIEGAPVLLAEPDRMGRETLRLLESVARRGRAYGVHLVLVGRSTELGVGAYPDALRGQFPVRVALPGGGDVLQPTNDSAAGLPVGTAVVNTAGGLGGPRGATRGHERTVGFPDPAADEADRNELRNRLWLARPVPEPPLVFDGAAAMTLDADPTYRAVLTAGSGPPVALLGRAVDATTGTATFALDDAPGRHLAVVGRSAAGAEVLAAAARSVSAAHPPGEARFVVAALVPEAETPAAELVAALRPRHEVLPTDAPGLAAALADGRPGYLVVFGMDAAGPADLPPEVTRTALRAGPARGMHLLSWWRRTRRLVELAGDGSLAEYVAGILLLDLPPIEAEYLLGREADWRPRPGRATLADRSTGDVRLIVPFGGGVR
ncbi:FtsK/SpoIIIE domain-containing protein [Plantactinospora siamensis]|uniref:FtsK/SpoIIIE domain-containing protein n=1 Tax=Plantactinospora siamensis TaxID=555372 RepID=A0ABV6P4Z9_9ACTN